ncbi:zinc finger, CCHC-type containing protein [Tanacetum coccineum]
MIDAAENIKLHGNIECKIHTDVACLMLGRMSPALQRQFEHYPPQSMLDELKKMFEKPPAVEIYDLVDTLHSCKQALGKSLYGQANPQVLAIQKGRVNKPKPQANKKGKSKGKADKNKQVVAYQPKPKQNPPQKKESLKKDQACHYCNVVGHWKRNCPLYLKKLRANKNKKAEHGAAALGKNGIVQHLTSPYTPQQNGVSERRNHTLLDMVPNLSYFKGLGCEAYVKRDSAPTEIYDSEVSEGYVFVVNGGAVDCKSKKKQTNLQWSATQAEYKDAS